MIREATLADLDALMLLEQACFPPEQAFSRDTYDHALDKAKAVNLAWEEDGELVGFAGAFCHRAWRTGLVLTLNVRPGWRRRGIGRALMEALHEALRARGMRRVVLQVNVENAAAIALYESLGYERRRRIPDYYEGYPDNDAFAYERAL